jgi:hypothetical protein
MTTRDLALGFPVSECVHIFDRPINCLHIYCTYVLYYYMYNKCIMDTLLGHIRDTGESSVPRLCLTKLEGQSGRTIGRKLSSSRLSYSLFHSRVKEDTRFFANAKFMVEMKIPE